MKVKYVQKTGRIYQVKTSIGAEITSHNTLKAAKETAKEYTLNTGVQLPTDKSVGLCIPDARHKS